VTISINATDETGIPSVDFYLDDEIKESDGVMPYEFLWDSTTIPDGTHTLTAKAYDTGGKSALDTISINVQNGDLEPPSAPTNLATAEVSWNQVDLYWSASTDNVGILGYDVYRDGAHITTSETTSFSDTGLSASTSYSYSVVAKDPAGNISEPSNVLVVSTDEQVLYGTLSGTVFSSFGGVISNVKVSINIQGAQIIVYTNTAGEYTITGLAPGGYSVKYIPPTGEHQLSSIQVNIQAGVNTIQNITLKKKNVRS
jgi:hypothetical protein